MDVFEENLKRLWEGSLWGQYRMVLALSGGADSVALFCAFARMVPHHSLLAVHVNHQLRGEESEGDARFAARLAERYSVAFREERIEQGELQEETEKEGSLEGGARIIRYRLLRKNAESFGARYLLTAHHADDQIETVLYRFFRGSGIEGLAGMDHFRPLNEAVVLVRPFLTFTRTEIEEYLSRLGETWRSDSSNHSSLFTRNRIRNELIPLLEDIFPGRINRSVLRLASQAGEMSCFLRKELDRRLIEKGIPLPEFFAGKEISVSVALDGFAGVPEELVLGWFRRLWRVKEWPMREMDMERWRSLSGMVFFRSPSFREFPGGIAVKVENGTLRIARSAVRKESDKVSPLRKSSS